MKNKNFVFFLAFLAVAVLLVPQLALAKTVTDDSIVTSEGEIKAGVTPDSPLYFMDRAFENMGLAFTFDNHKRSEKRMDIARERLMETLDMIEKGDLESAMVAQDGHSSSLNAIKSSFSHSSGSSNEIEFEKENEFERELEIELKEHKNEIQDIKNKIEFELDDGRLTAEQRASVDSVILLLEKKAGEVELEIENERRQRETEFENEFGDDSRRNRGGNGDGSNSDNSGPGSESSNSGPGSDSSNRETELRGRDNELGEDIRGNADENELRGRDNELNEDIRGNGDENELRGRDNELGEDIRGNADENEIRGGLGETEIRGPGDELNDVPGPGDEFEVRGPGDEIGDDNNNNRGGSGGGGSSSGGSGKGN